MPTYHPDVLPPFVLGEGYAVAQCIIPQEAESPTGGPHIGIVWPGSMSNPNDRLRSIPIALLSPLLDLPGITWHSLQIGPKAGECRSMW